MTESAVYKRDQVVNIINSVLGKIKPPSEAGYEVLDRELRELKDIIESLRNHLHTNQVSDVSQTHIPVATDELDAVVEATEQATESIMGACEEILEDLKGGDQEVYKRVEVATTKIFEACTFQDITGQRIKKVVDCLKEIEVKTASVLSAFEIGGVSSPSNDETGKQGGGEGEVVNLLNGPQLPQNAVTQEEIDKLLAAFDD